ncbi:MAG TPA: DegT/DnrJ/EryC1/StrS family aminotransferase [Actinomycetes bacterium]|jgi:dTDP-4-amino-4,6-dideoxygalactose transaminase|nr:DegT/DnrJ/EryC1/StrS family aminotransferase [Actinomycetes bacterium]
MSIPLVDLAAQHAEIAQEVSAGLAALFEASDFIGGKAVEEFERDYCETLGVPHCIGVANGTDALELALRAADVGPGDEVIVPANTFVATVGAVRRAGAKPVLADVDDECLLLDPDPVLAAITPRTKAIVPVHLYGQVAPIEELSASAAATGIAIIEDAAQAQGATRHGRPAGSFGVAAGTSFYPGKNLGAYGDAGAVLTVDANLARRVRLMRDHGSERKYDHEIVGWNSRLDTLQAIVLQAKLRRLARWNAARQVAAARYDSLLAEIPQVRVPVTMPGNVHVWHLYVVRVPERDRVLAALQAAGIGASIHYPTPIHLTGAYRSLGYGPGSMPVAEAAAEEILSLPLYPHITAVQQERVVAELKEALR